MSGIKYAILKTIGILHTASGWAKGANPQADTSKLESEIDQLVYQLYGLTQEEIHIVEGGWHG